MSRELLLLRHAKTEWDNPQGDFERGLTQQGFEEAEATGRWFATIEMSFSQVYCSTARRARQTWETVAATATAHWHNPIVYLEPRLYLAELPTLTHLLAEISQAPACVVLIGHNPGLEQLAVFLNYGPLPRNSVGDILATANVLRFRLPDNWDKLASGSGVLLDVFRPQKI
jgi:phosphohistidine phosphatase